MSFRKTWDKEYYEEKAKERLERGDDSVDEEAARRRAASSSGSSSGGVKEEFRPAEDGAAGPMGSERAFLKAREKRISDDLDRKVGKVEIIKPNSLEFARGGAGYFCEVCQCLLKDSASYLDHCNGKRHNRALGFSSRTERADVDAVKSRLDLVKRKIEETKTKPVISATDEYKERMAAQVAEEEARKRRKKEEKESRRKRELEEEAEEEGFSGGLADPELAAMMGFSSFTKT